MNISNVPSKILTLAGIVIGILATLVQLTETPHLDKNQSVEDIREADDTVLQSYYNKYRKEFGQWAGKSLLLSFIINLSSILK